MAVGVTAPLFGFTNSVVTWAVAPVAREFPWIDTFKKGIPAGAVAHVVPIPFTNATLPATLTTSEMGPVSAAPLFLRLAVPTYRPVARFNRSPEKVTATCGVTF